MKVETNGQMGKGKCIESTKEEEEEEEGGDLPAGAVEAKSVEVPRERERRRCLEHHIPTTLPRPLPLPYPYPTPTLPPPYRGNIM